MNKKYTLIAFLLLSIVLTLSCTGNIAIGTNYKIPSKYEYLVTTTPVKEQIGGTCWAFTSASLFESECIRKGIANIDINLSEMYMVYYAYLEKANAYLLRMGDSPLREGGKDYDAMLVVRKYGIVRESDYKPKSTRFKTLIERIKSIMDDVITKYKSAGRIPEDTISLTLEQVKAILDDIMGKVPESIHIDGKKFTPIEYARDVLNINTDDYLTITSFTHLPKKQYVELVLEDNWQHYDKYVNVELNDMVNIAKNSLRMGYSMYVCVDVSEPFDDLAHKGIMDILYSDDINDYDSLVELRQYHFDTGKTTEDHGMHLIGLDESKKSIEDDDYTSVWFLLKNSWGDNYGDKGFINMSERYFKLKILSITLNKEILKGYEYILP